MTEKKSRIKAAEERLNRLEQDTNAIASALESLQALVDATNEERVVGGPQETWDPMEYTPTVSIEASNVTYSSYDYLYIFLTPEREEGPHILVSDSAEFGEKGLAVGRYSHYEGEAEELLTTQSFDKAIKHIKELMDGASS